MLAALLLSGALLPILLGELFVMPELWSGVCIALSVAAYGTGRRRLGFASGFAALVLRELGRAILPGVRAHGLERSPLARGAPRGR